MKYICKQKISHEKIDQCIANTLQEAIEYFAHRKNLAINEWLKIYYAEHI